MFDDQDESADVFGLLGDAALIIFTVVAVSALGSFIAGFVWEYFK